MIPSTVQRVPLHTSESANQRIWQDTQDNIDYYTRQGRRVINERLEELDAEWDIERTLEANAAAVSLIGLTLGATLNKRWFLLPTAVSLFLLQHAIQGWCPPLEVFRQMGVRTSAEIDRERHALQSELRNRF